MACAFGACAEGGWAKELKTEVTEHTNAKPCVISGFIKKLLHGYYLVSLAGKLDNSIIAMAGTGSGLSWCEPE
jgi:hypothetical protein